MSAFGALPFVITKEIPSFIDAFFETVSGFTTTGSSIIPDLSVISHSNLFWRSFTHLVGGMGVLVLVLAIFPKHSPGSVHVMKAEVPGPTFGKLVSKLSATARVLYKIYLVMTGIMIVLLMLGGLDWFESSLLAFGTAGTGGFGARNGSIQQVSQRLILESGRYFHRLYFFCLCFLERVPDQQQEDLKFPGS